MNLEILQPLLDIHCSNLDLWFWLRRPQSTWVYLFKM